MTSAIQNLPQNILDNGSARLLLELLDITAPKGGNDDECKARANLMFVSGLVISTLCELREKTGRKLSFTDLQETLDLDAMIALYLEHSAILSRTNSIAFYLERALPRFDLKLAQSIKPQTPEVYMAHKVLIGSAELLDDLLSDAPNADRMETQQ